MITGAAGFLGQHLLQTLGGKHDLVSVARTQAPYADQFPWIQLSEPSALAQTVYRQKPEFIVHGAFVNRRPVNQTVRSYIDEMLATNLDFYDAAAKIGSKLLLLSSSAVYGRAQGHEVVDESCPCEPVSIYGIAKVNQELFATYAAENSGLQLSVLRIFNLCGPGQRLGMLLPDWVKQAVAIARGAEPRLKVFNMATSRDFVDVRDVARAIGLLIANFKSNLKVNVASGQAIPLTTIMQQLVELCPRTFEVDQTNPALPSSEVLRQKGSFERLNEGWGWTPQIPFEQSLIDSWQEWENYYNER
ncbi:NAD(P)-dependent oxidoreductase [bacterium]|nr:NAD(P)-dependent oxidoreductase [bacterium]